jgi:glycosyltransferase involved in cell wall biosynthesis
MIDILLPSYNGYKYLNQQIESILFQKTDVNWKLIIRDDCSENLTQDVISEYHKKHLDKIILVSNRKKNIGIIANLICLLQNSESDYILFCDQDDIWLPNKIEITYQKMLEAEEEYGKSTPILVHTDLQVVDRNLNLINSSFWNYQNLDPCPSQLLPRLLVQNFVTGCTMMINKPLKDLISSIPEEAIMHDWWIALVAATQGKIVHIPQPTVLYRQHQSNSIGAKKWSYNYILDRIKNIDKIRQDIQKTIIQAKKFREIYQDTLSYEHLQIIDNYIDLPNQAWLIRKYLMIRYGYYELGKLKNLGFLALI